MNKYVKAYFIITGLCIVFFGTAVITYYALIFIPTLSLIDLMILGLSVSVILFGLPIGIWLTFPQPYRGVK